MTTYDELKNELLQISQELSELLSDAGAVPGMLDASFGDWEKTCAEIDWVVNKEYVDLSRFAWLWWAP